MTGSVSFPRMAPRSLVDPDAIRANDWCEYKRLAQLQDHWDLKAWRPGYAAYYWYLTFSEDALVALVRECQQRLDPTHLSMVSSDGLHMTLVKVGAAESVASSALPQFVAAAEERLIGVAPFSVNVGPLAGSPSAVRFSVAPWDKLVGLHGRLRESVVSVRPTPAPKPTSQFRPHLGIAYNSQRRDAGPVVKMVAALRDIPHVPVSVDRVKLVRLWRTDHEYRWEECAVIPLQA
ncbi:2'-5' RNA ligase [Nocardia kruczakiae]|uniref:2'-5' RNA ligase n=1 Tax=Nocardia kruczakiae TaxID=261477 RepID=A0ABU1XQL5_9NOCA|nr:2'-5' RNA ligase family protein [Nocardia kruczakiae]MDR7172859.1 2'-5' RNA ligase [Nocardia kruczakiae]